MGKSALDLPKKYGTSRLRTWTTRATALAAIRKYHHDFTFAVLQHQPDRTGVKNGYYAASINPRKGFKTGPLSG